MELEAPNKGALLMDGFPEELFEVVNDHWSQFPAVNPMINQLFGICFLALTFVTMSACLLIIYVFATTEELRIPGNIFVVSLATSDFFIFLTQGPPMFISAFQSKFWIFGATACRLYGFTGAVFGTISIMTLLAISYERYNVIVKGFTGPLMTRRKVGALMGCIWMYSIIICLPPFFGWGSYKLEGLFLTCSYEYATDDWNPRSFMCFAFFFHYVVPLSAILYFYAGIMKEINTRDGALSRAKLKVLNIGSPTQTLEEAMAVEVQIAKVAIVNIIIWTLAWTPYAIICLTGAFGNSTLIGPIVSQLGSYFAKLASALNPIVLTYSHAKFRYALAKKLPCFEVAKPEDSDAGSCRGHEEEEHAC